MSRCFIFTLLAALCALPISINAKNVNDTKSSVVFALKSKMKYNNERHRLITENVANSATPNYRQRDLKKKNFFAKNDRSKRIVISATTKGHISPRSSGSNFEVVKPRSEYETNPVKNNVVLEEEMIKLTENSNEYNLATTVYKKLTGLVKLAAMR